MRSLRAYFHGDSIRTAAISSADHLIVTPEEEAIEFEKCLTENDKWNASVAEIRNARLARESEERKVAIGERLEAKVLRDELQMEKIEALVRYEKEQSKTFITKDGLDQAIEFALANPVDQNFAIDLQRNIFHGRNTPAVKEEQQQKSEIAASGV